MEMIWILRLPWNELFVETLSSLETDIFVINKLELTNYNVTNQINYPYTESPQVISLSLILIFDIRSEMDALSFLLITKAQ